MSLAAVVGSSSSQAVAAANGDATTNLLKKRSGKLSSITMTDGPTSTTKALMVSIVAPRKFVDKKKQEAQPEAAAVEPEAPEEEKADDPAINELLDHVMKATSKKRALSMEEACEPPDVIVVDSSKEEEVETKRESAPNATPRPAGSSRSVKSANHKESDTEKVTVKENATENLGEAAQKKEKDPAKGADEDGDNSGADVETAATEDTAKVAEATEENEQEADETEEEEKVTPEEAAAVTVGDDPEESEINVEELLRIAFKNLLEEWHLLNMPTYSLVLDKQAPILPGMSDQEQQKPEMCTWIRVEVMARPASLGVILERLERIGVGTNVGTVAFFKAELCRTASPYAHMPVLMSKQESLQESNHPDPASSGGANRSLAVTPATSTVDGGEDNKSRTTEDDEALIAEQERIKAERMIEEARNEWKNAATRLRIEQVREQIDEQAALSFDFIALLTIASILAGGAYQPSCKKGASQICSALSHSSSFRMLLLLVCAVGLITDNTVVIVASMLVSPIMGPVLGCTFGTRLKDWDLVKSSLLNETLALLGCIVIGALVSAGAAFAELADEWPTNEMEIRGDAKGLLIGMAIAIPSGMGVCLSILGGNTSSLVGVAISASLLPPAVNTGVCFVYSIFLKAGWVESGVGENANYFFELGAISFALTVLNIACIWVSGIVMFEIKEVAPTQQKNAFWARDIKTARKLNEEKRQVDVGVLRRGVTSALSKKRGKSDGPIGTVRIRPPKSKRTEFSSLDATLTLKPTQRWGPYGSPSFAAALNADEAGLEAVDENVRYVGLEDMAGLLGFDEEDEEYQSAPQYNNFGFLRLF